MGQYIYLCGFYVRKHFKMEYKQFNLIFSFVYTQPVSYLSIYRLNTKSTQNRQGKKACCVYVFSGGLLFA